MHSMIKIPARIFALVIAANLAAACETNNTFMQLGSKNNNGAEETISPFSQFPDLPIPTGSKIDIEKTLVFGSKPWFGQLALKSLSSTNQLFNFYRENLPQYGWQEITSVRAPTSILTYSSPERVLTIAIQSATLTGSHVTLTVSPRGENTPQSGDGATPTGLVPAPVQKLN